MPTAAEARSPSLVLSGTPRDRGRAHGETLREAVQHLIAAWEDDIGREVGMGLNAYLAQFEADTDFLPAIQRFTPDLLEEVHGIAEGASIPIRVGLALQCMDEHWTHLEQMQCRRRNKCSTFALAPSRARPTYLGQNMDLPKFLDAMQALIAIVEDSGARQRVVTYPGFLGLFGLNDIGLGVCVNALSQLCSCPRGLPVAYVVRGTLEHATTAAAGSWLAGLPHASGQNYLIGDADGFADFECCAKGVVRCDATAHLAHTNHPLANPWLGEAYVGWDSDRSRADEAHARTFRRLELLEEGLRREPAGVDSLARLLGSVSHPVDGAYPTFTFCSAVLELGRPPRMHLALGPATTPCRTFRV
ncbi:MAG: C45 family autoproteolytic acyltransferase/hydrolase [Myxococcota bacterium]